MSPVVHFVSTFAITNKNFQFTSAAKNFKIFLGFHPLQKVEMTLDMIFQSSQLTQYGCSPPHPLVAEAQKAPACYPMHFYQVELFF